MSTCWLRRGIELGSGEMGGRRELVEERWAENEVANDLV